MVNMRNTIIVVASLTALVILLVAASAVYHWSTKDSVNSVHVKEVVEVPNNRFVSLDKVIVMLRGSEDMPALHYIAVDLVFRTTEKQEPAVKGQILFLKSVAVRSLSDLTLAKATTMSIDDYQQLLDKAYAIAFAREGRARPFSEIMVAKLIIE